MSAQEVSLSTPLRVLLATARYFPYTGGTETHVYEVARRLAQRNVQVTVLTTDPCGQLADEEEMDGVHVRRVRSWPAKDDYYFAPDIYRIVAEGGWDIVHCQGCHTFVPPLAMLAALRTNIPYILTFHLGGHSSRLRTLLRGSQWRLLSPLFSRAERLVAVSHFEAKFFRERLNVPSDRFVFIPNGSNLPHIPPGSVDNQGEIVITSVGRLERYKGHHRIIAALPWVIEEQPQVRLRILGSGPHEATLRQQALDTGVAERVEIGAIPANDRQGMAQALSRSALVTLFSESESNPVAVMEAVAMGRSVLVADTTGLRELAERGLVRAIPLESSDQEVAQAILKQLRHPLSPPALKLPTWDGCATELMAVYQAVTRRVRCAS